MEPRALLSTFTVTTTADAGSGSLRQAIFDANAEPSADTIAFAIPGDGVQTIRPSSALTAPATIDGTTQPGYANRPLIALDGTGAGSASGILVKAAGCTIAGLSVGNFSSRGINIGGPPRPQVLGNLISGNGDAGTELGFDSVQGAVIQGNQIGTDTNSVLPLGNHGAGITINFDAGNSTIGGPSPGQANIIAYNNAIFTWAGVLIDGGSTGINISGNSIHDNKGLGIDLNHDGVTPNTPGGPHAGANLLQNYPVLTSTSASGTTTTVVGTLNAAPGTTYRLEFLDAATPDPTGYGQGQTYLGLLNVTTDRGYGERRGGVGRPDRGPGQRGGEAPAAIGPRERRGPSGSRGPGASPGLEVGVGHLPVHRAT